MCSPEGRAERPTSQRPTSRRERSPRSGWLALGALLLAAGACAPGRPLATTTVAFEESSGPVADLAVEVLNEHWTPMAVWVHWPGMRRFLGDAEPGRTTLFRIPADLARRHATLQLHAEASGSIDEVDTKPIDVQSGRVIEWRLRKVLANSHARVR